MRPEREFVEHDGGSPGARRATRSGECAARCSVGLLGAWFAREAAGMLDAAVGDLPKKLDDPGKGRRRIRTNLERSLRTACA